MDLEDGFFIKDDASMEEIEDYDSIEKSTMDLEDGFFIKDDASMEEIEDYDSIEKPLKNLRIRNIRHPSTDPMFNLRSLSLSGVQFQRFCGLFAQMFNLRFLSLNGVQFQMPIHNFKKMPDLLRLPNLRTLTIQDGGSLPTTFNFDDRLQLRHLLEENANSEEWIFLVSSLFMEIFSAACDQFSSPSRPWYALFGMLLAIAALLTCTGELIYKGRKKNDAWRKKGCYMLFGSAIESYSLVGGIAQCVCSIIQYVYYIRQADNPIKLSLLPAIFLICLIIARLSGKRMQTTYKTQ